MSPSISQLPPQMYENEAPSKNFDLSTQMYENKTPSQKPWLEYRQYMKSIKLITC
jgi:hypothetical protein